MQSSKLPFGEWLQTWLQIYAPLRCSSNVTLERYQRLSHYLTQNATAEMAGLAHTPLTEVTYRTLESALLSLLTAPAQRREHLSRRSVRHLGGLLSVALQRAWRLELICDNPMKRVELPQPEIPSVRSLTLEEIERLRRACRGHWTAPFVELALAAGCRRGELLALEWSDLDHITRVLSITKALEQSKRYGLRLKLPKNGRGRRCTLPCSTVRLLGTPGTGLLFPARDGGWRSPALVSQTIVRRMRKAGIHDASLHSLRHTHATALLSQGLPLPAVSSRLGHTDPNITLRFYGHVLPPDDLRLADAWDALVARMH